MILILWRPTKNNQRYGLEEIRNNDDDSDDEETGIEWRYGQEIKLRNVRELEDDDDVVFSVDSEDTIKSDKKKEEEEDVLLWAERNLGEEDVESHAPNPDKVIFGNSYGFCLICFGIQERRFRKIGQTRKLKDELVSTRFMELLVNNRYVSHHLCLNKSRSVSNHRITIFFSFSPALFLSP